MWIECVQNSCLNKHYLSFYDLFGRQLMLQFISNEAENDIIHSIFLGGVPKLPSSTEIRFHFERLPIYFVQT